MPHRVRRAAGQDAHPVEGEHCSRPGRTQPGTVGVGVIQVAPQMRILVAIEAVDLRKGIDGLAQLCREKLGADPFSGCLFIFRSRRATAIKVLAFDGQGFWMAQKRLSQGRAFEMFELMGANLWSRASPPATPSRATPVRAVF